MFNFKNCKYSRNKCVKFDILLKKDIYKGVGDKIMYYVCFIFFLQKTKKDNFHENGGKDIERYEFIDIAII